MTTTDHGTERLQVLINHEEQYSLWPADKAVPNGWRATGTQGSKDDCLQYVDEVWTDMRPLSLRMSIQRNDQA